MADQLSLIDYFVGVVVVVVRLCVASTSRSDRELLRPFNRGQTPTEAESQGDNEEAWVEDHPPQGVIPIVNVEQITIIKGISIHL